MASNRLYERIRIILTVIDSGLIYMCVIPIQVFSINLGEPAPRAARCRAGNRFVVNGGSSMKNGQ